MKKGYYMWRWFDTNQIVFDPDLKMHSEDFAKTQGCFRRFDECKKKAISDLQGEIAERQQALNGIKSLKISEVRKL